MRMPRSAAELFCLDLQLTKLRIYRGLQTATLVLGCWLVPTTALSFDIGDLLKPRLPGTTVPGTKVPLPPLLKPPAPPTSLDDLDPYCRIQIDTHRPSPSSDPTCGAYGANYVIPQYFHYGDKRVNIREQCVWHDECYVARWHGGTLNRTQCDNTFREKLRAECRRTVARCKNVLRHCYDTVETYYAAVKEYGQSAWDTDNSQEPRPSDPTVYGSSSNASEIALQFARANNPWVYIGAFDEVWVERNFDLPNNSSNQLRFGDQISAIVDVNVRKTHMYFDRQSGEWIRPERVRTMRVGENASIIDVVAIGRSLGGYYYWVQLAN